jgi:RNA polymerase sigma factor FliA
MGTSSFSGKNSSSRSSPWDLLEQGALSWNELEGNAREQLVQRFAPKIKILAQRLKAKLPPSIELGELISSGSLGLLEALENFNPSLGIKLTTFAESRIRGAMLDDLRKLDWFSRGMRRRIRLLEQTTHELEQERGCTPSAHDLQIRTGLSEREVDEGLEAMQNQVCLSLDAAHEHLFPAERDSIRHEPYHWVAQQDIIDKLAALIDDLTPRERLVLSLYYVEELTMKETARVMEITEGRVSQLHSQSLAKIRVKFKKTYVSSDNNNEEDV